MPPYERERFATLDGDFFDVDCITQGSPDLIVALHGLTDGSVSQYIRALGRYTHHRGWDFAALNYRSCSGECNRYARDYHLAFTDDLHHFIQKMEERRQYRRIVLVGYSIGGNIGLHYLAARGDRLSPLVRGAVNFSVPLDVTGAHARIHRGINRLYVWALLAPLYRRLREKRALIEAETPLPRRFYPTSFRQYDARVTVPLNGFESVEQYYQAVDLRPHLSKIRVPHLLVQARNDRFLSSACYPIKLAKNDPYLQLEMPRHGGHCGFITHDPDGYWWMERRVFTFIEAQLSNQTEPHALPAKKHVPTSDFRPS